MFMQNFGGQPKSIMVFLKVFIKLKKRVYEYSNNCGYKVSFVVKIYSRWQSLK